MAWINPIFDRTKEDVDYLKSLMVTIQTTGWGNVSQSVRDEWLAQNKGAINYTDLNRIEENIEFIVSELENVGISIAIDRSNPTWTLGAYLLIDNINRIRNNLNLIINGWYSLPSTPTIKYSNPMNYLDANDLERVLYDLKVIWDLYGIQVRPICGKAVCGTHLVL